MKKTLLSALLLMVSGLVAQAQGFRVYRSDGAVYQFSWVADSLVFYEGEGDPDYQEPVPESVQNALDELRASVTANVSSIAALNAKADQTQMYVMSLQTLIDDLQASGRQNKENITSLQSVVSMLQNNVMAIQNQSTEQAQRINLLTDLVNTVQMQAQENTTNITELKMRVANAEDIIYALQEQNTSLQGQNEVLEQRISDNDNLTLDLMQMLERLTARVEQLESQMTE